MNLMGKELVVVMETDSGWMRHGPVVTVGRMPPTTRLHCGWPAGTSGTLFQAALVLYPLRDTTVWQCEYPFMSNSEGPEEMLSGQSSAWLLSP